MLMFRYLTACAALYTFTPAARSEDLDGMADRCRGARVIVVGRVTNVHSCDHPQNVPGVGTVATATVRVERHLKGASEAKTVEVELRCESTLTLKPDDEDVIWFIGERLDNGRYLLAGWKWGTSSARYIEHVLRLLDRATRTPGMPESEAGDNPLTLVLGAEDGSGKALTTARVASSGGLSLLAQFENHKPGVQSVMPCLYGSAFRWRHPYYDLEVVDADGKKVPRGPVLACHCVGPFGKWDVVPLDKGEVFRTEVPIHGYESLPRGKYRVRLRYTAKQDATISVRPDAKLHPEVAALFKAVWEGELRSNWIEVEVGVAAENRKP